MKRAIFGLLAAVTGIALMTFARRDRGDTLPELPAGTVADRIVIDKSERSLRLFSGSRAIKTYQVALGRDPIGHKQQEGDGRTPEGFYKVDFTSGIARFIAPCTCPIRMPQTDDRPVSAASRRVVTT